MARKKDPEQEFVRRVVAELKKERLRQELSMYRLAKMSTISDRATIEASTLNTADAGTVRFSGHSSSGLSSV